VKDNAKVTRREFITTTAAVGACMCGLNGCLLFSLEGDTPQIHPPAYAIEASNMQAEIVIDTGKAPELLNEGCAVKIIDPRIKESIIIANTGENGFAVLSIACPHNGFEVEYLHDRKIFKCISVSRAEFACDGQVLSGPPRKPLTSYPIRRQNDKLIVSIGV
jgi:nitrite reductase/ring-hydroxylating ferredoxin subunit